ncbi:EF-hand domain-containing protein [Brevundimonas sp. SORGH_AS_0993]|uniref:EF-hand domain-containing protein n=1 Tax=Brevundimonas sp. SORGH_AS_0993 TaxID=3041794 RepID=UPI00277E5257|nr:EF-hand domain-containing protein [Brevundimonas sp. SORGH_AS_0993]MDQ1155546.1 hypothetical protein [Brevundimonas sp. SORGH_AS_0993]
MRLTFITGLGVVALVAAGAAAAGAATALTPPAPSASAPASHHARQVQAGPLTRAAYVDDRVARLTALDTNGDGVVSPEERQAGRAAHRAGRADARFARMDANGDGMISRAEFDAAAAKPDHGPRGVRMGRRGGHDRPGGERQAKPITISDVAVKLGQRFDAMDSNHDGVISPEERSAARAAHRAERPTRRAPRPAMAPQAASPAPTSE